MDLLRLMALDAGDLDIVSAHVQDAVIRIADIAFAPERRQFALPMNRFVWEKTPPRQGFFRRRGEYERRRSVLHFDRVLGVRRSGFRQSDDDAVLALLALRWTAGEEPSGTIDLVFAGGAAIRLDVECIEAQLTDLGAAWSTPSRPDHDRG
jgi:hypothetical protein